jgi:hypothetical protein
MSWRGIEVSGTGRIVLIGALLGGLGIVAVRAQAVLGDPRDAPKIFAANCSACHKSPRGLAKSGQVAGFLRQHYTTGPEMSAAMAAYLVAAGSAPPEKKSTATADGAGARTKGKKGEQVAAQSPAEAAEAAQQRTLRGKQRQTKAHEEAQTPAQAAPSQPAPEETKQAAVADSATPAAEPAAAAAAPPQPALMVLDIPLPPMPDAPPPDLTQSVFASSPLP